MLIKLLLSIVLINAIKFILNEEYGFDVKKGQKGIGTYQRSQQTLDRLKRVIS